MTLNSIYIKYQIPPNLQRHMRDVASVCLLILENWIGETVDQQLAIRSALLHDLGNIVKFKRPFMGDLEDEAERWQNVQDEIMSTYGADAKKATHKMVEELGHNNTIGKVLHDMDLLIEGVSNVMTEAKIVEFADLCVSPAGIVGYERRKQDLIDRYGATHGLGWVEPAERLLLTLQKNVDIDLTTIETYDFSEYGKIVSQIVLEDEIL